MDVAGKDGYRVRVIACAALEEVFVRKVSTMGKMKEFKNMGTRK